MTPTTRTAGVAPATVLGLVSLALYGVLARLAPGNGWRDTGTFLVLMAALFALYAAAFVKSKAVEGRRLLLVIMGGAILFRLALVPAGLPRDTPLRDVGPLLIDDLTGRDVVFERHLLYDDDHWRYLWDGHVAASGIDPRAFPPDDRRLDALATDSQVWEQIRANVNHPWLTTIYPPLPQLVFRVLHALAPGSVVALKLVWILADLAAILLIRKTLILLRGPSSLLLLYAWNPLLIKVTAGSAHFDVLVALGVALLAYGVASRRRLTLASGWIAAVGAKVTPLVFLLPVARRLGWRWTAAAIASSVMLLASLRGGSGSEAFSRDWEFNATFFHLLKLLFTWTGDASLWARVAVGGATIASGVWAARRFDLSPAGPRSEDAADDARKQIETFASAALIPMGVLLLCGPVLMPWYLIWVLPLAAVARRLFWFQLTAVTHLAFLVMVDGRERGVVLFLEGICVFLLLAWRVRCNWKEQRVATATKGAP